MGVNMVAIPVIVVVVLFVILLGLLSRYRKCPSDKVLVIYGKVGTDKSGQSRSAKCIHGGAAFIVPVLQSYQYMDLTPISIIVDLKNALSKQNIRVDVPSRFTVGISTEPGIMQNAAERLLGLKLPEIQELAKDIIFGQLRLIIATMDIEEINTDRDKFLLAVSNNVEIELKKIGLRLINVNVTDINDESGYIEALARKPRPRPSTTPRRAWPRRTATVRSARPTPTWISAFRCPPPTPPPSRVKTTRRWRSPSPTPAGARRRPRRCASRPPPKRCRPRWR
jgi:flotillin